MSATALISSMAHRRIGRAGAWLRSRGPAEELLVIGASLDAANELARITCRGAGSVFGWHRLSLAQLAATLAKPGMAAVGIVPVGKLGADATVCRAIHMLNSRGALGRYATIADGPGFSRAIANVLSELRLACIDPDVLNDLDPDLLKLLRAYEAEMAQDNVIDWPSLLGIAAEVVSRRGRAMHHLAHLPKLLLDVPIANQAELNFVAALCASDADVLATVPAADESTIARFRDGLRLKIEDLDSPDIAGGEAGKDSSGSLRRLQRHLFREDIAPNLPRDDQVVIFSAPGESRESVEIARRVLALAGDGLAFDRMAVLLRAPEQYRAHLDEAFARAGVPVHFARGAVRPDPTGRAFFVLLRCAAEGLSAQRFAEYLSLAQVPDAAPDGTPPEAMPRSERWVTPDDELALIQSDATEEEATGTPVDAPVSGSDTGPVIAGQLRAPRRWERFLVEAAVIGGRERWRRRMAGLANELQLKLGELADEDEARAATLRRTLEDLNALAGYALPLIDALDALPASALWGEWLDQLGALATRALRQPDRVLSVLSELAPMASVGPVDLEEVLLVLADLLLQVAVPPANQRYGGVFIGPVEAARGLSFEAVFVPGVAEKLFPHRIIEEPILLDAARKALNIGLDTNDDRLANERLALALAAGAAERRLYLSYPRLDLGEGRPRVPSFYALEAVRAAEGRLPDFAELAREAETVTSARIGWPAPSDPDTAIDDAEYDLAVLERLFSLPEAHAGSARYLLTTNSYLARALRMRYQRWHFHWTPADGLVSSSHLTQPIMAMHRLAARSYSPTALQNYAACPYKFFLQAIHRLAPREVPDPIDELDPLQRGSLIHDIQLVLFERLRSMNLLPIRPARLDQARDVLEGVIHEVAGRYYDDLAPAIDRVWEDNIAAIRADLREWLRRASEDESGYIPWRFELSFGLPYRDERHGADPASVPGAVRLDCGIRLRGAIDLVERRAAGLMRVTDHKTGRAQAKAGQVVAGGAALQPVLYALIAEKLFGDTSRVECGRLYFCTSAGGFAEHVVPLDRKARAAAHTVADTIGNAIAGPFLPAAPRKRECEWCDYRVVCGPYEELRTGRKPKQRLEPLLRLRDLP